MILFYICSQFLESTWKLIFDENWWLDLVNLALDCDKQIDLLRTSWIKFIGSIVNYDIFNTNIKLIEKIVTEIFKVKDESNM